jgi:hypothetical protein
MGNFRANLVPLLMLIPMGGTILCQQRASPPSVCVSKGACPFECCRYGKWVAFWQSGWLFEKVDSFLTMLDMSKDLGPTPAGIDLENAELSKDWTIVRIGEMFSRRMEPGRPGLPDIHCDATGLVERESVDRRVETSVPPAGDLLIRSGDLACNMMRMCQGVPGHGEFDVRRALRRFAAERQGRYAVRITILRCPGDCEI